LISIIKEIMGRPSDYGKNKVKVTLTLTPTARRVYQCYADHLCIAFGELIERIVRNPDVARGMAAFLESEKKVLEKT
jgi:hypothetical protein